MTAFEFATATRIVFGAGKLAELPALASALGIRRALLVTGKKPGRAARAVELLAGAGIETLAFPIHGEPTVDVARDGVSAALAATCDAVIAMGGGSAIDAGKAIAALVTNGGDPLDYLEVIGRGRTIAVPPLPFIAIPTTAGTGAEVTRNAVLGSPADRVKVSLRSPLMLPQVALIDPELLVGVPKAVLAASGMDALSQLIEPFVSARANPLTDALARDGIARSARALPRVAGAPDALDAAAREDLALASLLGGLCLANAGLGAVHGFAGPAGGMFDAPHGAVCAALLPAVMDVNRRALVARAPAHPGNGRLQEVAVLLTGHPGATCADGIAWVERLRVDLEIPGLARWGLTAAEVPALVARARVASSMKANPIVLDDDELTEIALRSL